MIVRQQDHSQEFPQGGVGEGSSVGPVDKQDRQQGGGSDGRASSQGGSPPGTVPLVCRSLRPIDNQDR